MSFARQTLLSTIPKLARGYATPNTVQAPLVLHGIDGRYATALYTAAAKKKVLETVETELKQVQAVVKKDSKIQFFLENPTLNRDAKREGVKSLLKSGKYSDITKNLFETLAENGRLGETNKIIAGFLQLMMAHRGELPVTITSSKPLDKPILDKLHASLAKGNVAGNQKLIISNKVNPSIIGGLIIEFGDKTIDLSVSSKVSKLNKLITDTV